MKAESLPDEMKRSLLDQVRRQVGEENYNRAVSEVGENRLLDLCLDRSIGAAAPPKQGCLIRCLQFIWELITDQWWITIPLIAGAFAGETGWGIATILCMLWLCVIGLMRLMSWFSRIGSR